jgi:drug/metabolite transporter (DMT)-like permease
VSEKKNHTFIAASLLLTVTVWGGNNAGTKWLLREWTPVFTGMTRFIFAGAMLMAMLRFTKWLGEFQPLTRAQHGTLWLRGGLSLAL